MDNNFFLWMIHQQSIVHIHLHVHGADGSSIHRTIEPLTLKYFEH